MASKQGSLGPQTGLAVVVSTSTNTLENGVSEHNVSIKDHQQLALFGECPKIPREVSYAAKATKHDDGRSIRSFRVIHYLGSKMRLLEPIRNAIADIAPPPARVCDLFAGSGIVSLRLASEWDVTSVDIQEYSRVFCNGLFNAPKTPELDATMVCDNALNGTLKGDLYRSLSDLLEYESESAIQAQCGDIINLCALVECGSLFSLISEGNRREGHLEEIMRKSWKALYSVRGGAIGPETVVTRYFGGIYFSWKQAADLDALLDVIHKLDDRIRDYYLTAALAVASDIVNTVGKQFAQPIKPRTRDGRPKTHLVRQIIRDRSIDVTNAFRAQIKRFMELPNFDRNHIAIRGDYREVLADNHLQYDAVYADPPYTRDHYSRFYHVLETMARHDEPVISTTAIRSVGDPRLSRGHYRVDRHQSPFCIKSKAALAFRELFSGISNRRIPAVVSYSPYGVESANRPRMLTIDELQQIAQDHFRSVEVRPVEGISHNKLNLSSRNVRVNHHAEVLLVCT